MEERVGTLPPPGTPPEALARGAGEADGTTTLTRNSRETVTNAHMRRKKWSEEEEDTLLSKYAELMRAGTLTKLKTREKKFEPIAVHVNGLHHSQDKVSFPWEWTWRDLSVKIQNMRHQYLGVKQKIRRPPDPRGVREQQEEYDWAEGIIHWSNFLKYKEVFGDLELEANDTASPSNKCTDAKAGRVRSRLSTGRSKVRLLNGNHTRQAGEGAGSPSPGEKALSGELGVSGLGQECDWDEDDDARNDDEELGSKKKKQRRHQGKGLADGDCLLSEGKILAFLGAHFADQREREIQRETREREKEKERAEREIMREEAERHRELDRLERERIREELERKLRCEREEREKSRELIERERWAEDRQRERAYEEKRERDKQEWRERMTTLQLEHQASMTRLQSQMIQSQQNMVSLLVGLFLHGGQVGDPTQRTASFSLLASQILRNLQQLSGATGQGSERKAGIEASAHFIVDGDVCVTGAD